MELSLRAWDKLHYPFELPDGWCWCQLEDLCEVVRGGSPRPAGSKVFYDGDIPFLKVADLTKDDEMYVYKAESSIKAAGLKKTRMVNEGTLLLTNSGATLGVPKITRFSTTFNDGIAAFLYLSEHIIPYIYWLLKSMTDSFRSIDQGAAQPNLNTNLIKDVNVPLPPIREQKRIVEKIKYVFGIIGQLDKSNDNLQETIKQAKSKILDLAIHGKLVPQDPTDEPASELLKRINPKAEITCDTPQYGKLPKGWALTTVRDVFNINPKNKAETTQTAGFVPMTNICDGFNSQFTYETKEWGKIKSGFTHFADGDIAVAKISPCLENRKSMVLCNLPNGIGAGTTELHVFRPLCVDALYGLYFFKSDYFISNCVGTFNGVVGQQRVSKSIVEAICFHLPPLNEQRRIVTKIEELFAQLDKIEASL